MAKARQEKLYIQVFHEIRGYIIENDLQPGDPLPTEQAMCELLGVSRNVLREAMKSMELMGMIEASPGRGTTVRDFNPDFVFDNALLFSVRGNPNAVHEMLDLLKRLELSYMDKAYQAIGDEDIARLRRLIIGAQGSRGKPFTRADDRAFHTALFEPLGNRALLSMMDAIYSADSCFYGEDAVWRPLQSADAHERIVSALEARDYAAFAGAMAAHYAPWAQYEPYTA